MAKFVLECPYCERHIEAKTGLFARRKISCTCGHTIDVKTEKMATRSCPNCNNLVVFDVSKKDKVKCPVCRKPIRAIDDKSKMVEFSCAQCGIGLHTVKTADTYQCPICDYVNNVTEQVKKSQIRKDGFASVIKYEGDNDTLVWKHPIEDFNMGSQLIVHESQEAIFFKDGQALDLFGAGRYTLETQQLPLIEKIYNLPTDTEGTFHSEVYFVNLATRMANKWGTDTKVRMFDPTSGLHVELGASGEYSLRVINSRKLLLKLVGTSSSLTHDELMHGDRAFFRSLVVAQVKSYLAQVIKESNISVLEIDAHLMTLSESLRQRINIVLEEYGLLMPEFFVARIVTPDEDPNFRRMKEQYAAEYLQVRDEEIRRKTAEAAAQRKTVEAETEARMKIIEAQGDAEALKIKAMAEADAYRAQALAEAEEMRAKGYTYQQETARMIGMETMQNGITGSGGDGGSGIMGSIGDLAGLGISLGAVGSVMGMTKEVMNPIMETTSQLGKSIGGAMLDSWDCVCGNKGITAKFCGECGAKKPEPKIVDMWNCSCGNTGITAKFCGECGKPRPVIPTTWDCECGNKGIIGKFCGECGNKKPE